MAMPRSVRKKRQAYEDEMLFEGMRVFVRAAHKHAESQIDPEAADREAEIAILAGMIVEDMWKRVVSTDMTYEEYRRTSEEEIEEQIKHDMDEMKRREDEAAEESGYRIV